MRGDFLKRCLIMITSNFPFGIGETYIESEVLFLKERFEKIIILPIEIDPETEQTRSVPDGIEFYNVSSKKQKIARAGDVIGGLKNLFSPTVFSRYDRSEFGTDIRKRMFFEYFCNRSVRSFRDCLKVLEKYDFSDYDSVTVYSYWFFATALVGVLIKEYLEKQCEDVKLISRAHRYDVYEDMNALNYLPLRRFLLERCDAVYPCSDSGTQHIKELYPEYEKKVKTAYLGTMDMGISSPSQNGLHIVSCSQIIDVKRVDRIVDILEKIGDSDKYRIKWTHIGDGNRRRETEQRIKNSSSRIDAEFLGSISNREVYEFYKNSSVDLFISTSRSEGLPVSMMEAASFGIPIVSTDVGGVGEIVKNGYNGCLLPENAPPEKFAEFIRYFYDTDEEEKNVYRSNSRKLWEEKFDARKTYTEFFPDSEPLYS